MEAGHMPADVPLGLRQAIFHRRNGTRRCRDTNRPHGEPAMNRVRHVQREIAQQLANTIRTHEGGTEFVPWLETMDWVRYLGDLDQ